MPLRTTGLNVAAQPATSTICRFPIASGNLETGESERRFSIGLPSGRAAAADGEILAANEGFTSGSPNGLVTHICLWSTATGGTIHNSEKTVTSVAFTNNDPFDAAGAYTAASATPDF